MAGPRETTPGAPHEPEATVEVFVQQTRSGTPKVGIQLNIWSKSLGWRPQKTLLFDPSQLPDLRRQLAAAEVHLRQTAVLPGDDEERGKVLPFPTLPRTESEKES